MRFSKLLKGFIESKIINVFITLVILINAATLGLETSEQLVSRFGNILCNSGSNVSKMIKSATNDKINTKK